SGPRWGAPPAQEPRSSAREGRPLRCGSTPWPPCAREDHRDPIGDLLGRTSVRIHDGLRRALVSLAARLEKRPQSLLERAPEQKRARDFPWRAEPLRGLRRIDLEPHDPRMRLQELAV